MRLSQHQRIVAIAMTIALHGLLLIGLYYLYIDRHASKPILTEIELLPIAPPQAIQETESKVAALSETSKADQQKLGLPAKPSAQSPQEKIVPATSTKPKQTKKSAPVPTLQTQKHEESLRQQEATQSSNEKLLQEELRKQQLAKEEQARRERERLEEEARQKALVAQKASAKVSSAFGATNQVTGTTNNGAVGGQPSGGANTGTSIGQGSHTLSGRSIMSNGGRLSSPTIKKAVRGRVNVRIVVDATGHVTSAEVALSGTNIADASVRSAAISAAKQTVFNPQAGAEPQKGIITYNFEIE